jgi:hypothetical protein
MRTVLAVLAHPDDAELTCFGTLRLLKSQVYRVLIGIIRQPNWHGLFPRRRPHNGSQASQYAWVSNFCAANKPMAICSTAVY